jgi:ABC-type polar amino acid transport system ATPase subunit
MSNNNAVRVLQMNTMDVRFLTHANYYICGQSQSGKSHLVRSMLDNLEELFYPVPTKILYFLCENQK